MGGGKRLYCQYTEGVLEFFLTVVHVVLTSICTHDCMYVWDMCVCVRACVRVWMDATVYVYGYDTLV